MRSVLPLLGILLLAGCGTSPAAAPPATTTAASIAPSVPPGTPTAGHRRSVAYGTRGVVAAAHPLAAQVGIDILRQGGNAVDAAIATNAALGFLEPNANGMGGDLFAIVWSARDQRLYGLNASGRAPAALTSDKVKPLPDGTIDPRSPASWSVPGCVDGWAALHGKFGDLPWPSVFAPAIQLAEQGAPVPRVIAHYWGLAAERFKDMPGFRETFMPEGTPPLEGSVFRNPTLAATLNAVATGGRDAFYKGELARRMVAFSEEHGGYFAASDFAEHRSEWVTPVSVDYRGVTVYELPPNGQGIAALEMLQIMERFDLGEMGRHSPDLWHTLVEAKKLAFADRAAFYADPAFAQAPIDALLSDAHAERQMARIDSAQAARRVDAPKLEHGDTTFLATADAAGNMVALIQSNYTGFGSGHAVLGFGLQNRGALFNLDASHPNALQPKKRPFHTIIPAFAMRDGQPWLAFGVMGGAMQPQGHAQIIMNLVDFNMDLQQAGDAARFRHTGSTQPTGTSMEDGGVVWLEPGVSESVAMQLRRRGHDVRRGGSFGGYQAVARDPKTGVLSGATESRKDGVALAY